MTWRDLSFLDDVVVVIQMPLYLALCPELRRFPSAVNRVLAIRKAKQAVKRTDSLKFHLAFWPIIAAVFVLPSTSTDSNVLPWMLILFSFAVLIAFFLHESKQMRNSLRNQLTEKQLCLHCGYNLTGNRSGVCSECGAGI